MNHSAHSDQKGFTLVELIVVIFIFVVISGVLLFRYSSFSTNVSVRNLAQEVALSVRKTQTLATSVTGADVTNAFEATRGYGMYFSLSENTSKPGGDSKTFTLFKDQNDDGLYNQSTTTCGTVTIGNECLERFSITTGDSIKSVCVERNCTPQSGLIIYFRRPTSDARIYYESVPGTLYSYADIVLTSARGLEKTVRIWNTGQIGVLP